MRLAASLGAILFVLSSGQVFPEEPATPARVDSLGDPLPDGVLARMGSGRMRHGDFIRALAFSPDGKNLAAAGHGRLRVFDVASGKATRTLPLDADWGADVAFSADMLAVVTSQAKPKAAQVHVFDNLSGALKSRFEIHEGSSLVRFSTDGGLLAVMPREDVVVYDTENGQVVHRLPGYARDIAFTSDAKQLITCDISDTVRVRELATGKPVRELKHAGDKVIHIAISSDDRLLLAISWNDDQSSEAGLWDLTSGKEIQRLKSPNGYFLSAVFSPDGKTVLTGLQHPDLILWDTTTGNEVRRFANGFFAGTLAFSADGRTVASGGTGTISLWDVASGNSSPSSPDPILSVRDLRFIHDSRELIGLAERPLRWDANTGKQLVRLHGPRQANKWFYTVSPDLRHFADRGEKGEIILGDAATGDPIETLRGHEDWVWTLRFTPDGRRLCSGSWDRTVRLWDVSTGKELFILVGHTSCVNKLVCSPDGRLLASASTVAVPRVDYTTRVWDLETGKELRRFRPQCGSAFAIAFSHDSSLLAACGSEPGRPNERGGVQVWDVATGRQLRSFGEQEQIACLAFAPDGRSLATGALDKQLILWEIASGKERHRFVGHNSSVNSVAFSSDGRRLAASSPDAPVYIWDATGLLLGAKSKLTAEMLADAWNNLAGEDAAKAFGAIRQLASDPERSIPFLREHLKPAPPLDSKHVEKLIAQLDSPKFTERQQAATELAKLAEQLETTLQRTLKGTASPEVRRQVEKLLEGMDRPGAESLRQIRAIEALEWMATPEAVRLLADLAKGGAEARLTREADAARKRLTSRTP